MLPACQEGRFTALLLLASHLHGNTAKITVMTCMQLSSAWESLADISSITIRSKPLRDDESHEWPCPRCKTPLALLNHHGDECPACGARIVRCFATFQPLPLVEFELAPGLSDDEAQTLLEAEPLQLRGRYEWHW
jgi:hypothetical protein